MNQNEQILPVSHGAVGATTHVAAGAAGGALKGGAVWYGLGALASTVIGGIIGAGGIAGLALTWPVALGIAGGAALGLTVIGPFAGGIGALFGGITGGGKAHDKVQAENAAANVMSAQVEVLKAQQMAQAQDPANDNRYNFPPQGSSMNQAGSNISAMQADGRVNGMQLQRG